MTCPICGGLLYGTYCGTCAAREKVYEPSEETIWSQAALVRRRESEEKGGVLCLSDAEEKAWRRAQEQPVEVEDDA